MSEVAENSEGFPTLKDYETDVFDAVYPVYDDVLPAGNFRSEYVPEPESFPLVTLIRMDSIPDWSRESTSDYEDLTVDTYEMHVYALGMDECKHLANLGAERMRQMNFHRLTMRPVLNGNDIRISHIVARFEHRIDRNGTMYR
jgi:hypothetical protein